MLKPFTECLTIIRRMLQTSKYIDIRHTVPYQMLVANDKSFIDHLIKYTLERRYDY